MKRLAIAVVSVLLAGYAHAQFADLGESLFFVRSGFEDTWTRTLPALDDGDWTLIPPTHGSRPLSIRSMGLPDSPRARGFGLIPAKPREYTVVVPFQADLTLLNASDPALFLKHIGQGWSVYLNGVLLRNELIKPGEGYIKRPLRNVVVPLDKRRLVHGENVLTFRLWGDPGDPQTGFGAAAPYVIDSYRILSSGNSEYVDLMMIGIYVFFALYHGVLYALRPKDTGYLFFGLSTLVLAAYLFSRSNVAASLVFDMSALRVMEHASLFFSVPALTAFVASTIQLRRSRFVLFVAALAALLSVASLFLGYEPLLRVWMALAAVSVVYLIVFAFVTAAKRAPGEDTGQKAPEAAPRPLVRVTDGLFKQSSTGIVMLGGLALGAVALVDVLDGGFGAGAVPWSRYALFVFMLLMSGVLAARFASAAKRAEVMNTGLEAEVDGSTGALAKAASERVRLNEEVAAANALLGEVMAESERDMRIAAIVQKGFFPERTASNDEWDIALVFEPASGISRDFYDFYQKDGKLTGLVVGTVSGAGVAGGLVTVLAKNVLGRGMHELEGGPLRSTLAEINRRLIRELSVVGNTVSCALMNLDDKRIEFVNAAHTDALLRRAGRTEATVIRPKTGQHRSPPLGREDFEANVSAMRFSMAPGDALLLYTAGLIGNTDAKGLPYGEERLAEALKRADTESAESILTSIMIDFRNAVSGARRSGDITAIVMIRR